MENEEEQNNTTELDTSDLNPKQKLFCELYSSEKEFFGNGVQSYIEAYEPDQTKKNWYKSACSSASRLLRNVKVIKEINRLLEVSDLNDAAVDKQLAFLITQHSDFSSKIAAIREYNKLKQRIIDKTDITSKGEKIESSEKVKELEAKFNAFIKGDNSSNPA